MIYNNAETIVVLIANGITATLAAAMVLILLWQGPRQRLNQSLALAMFCLSSYCVLNGTARFADQMNMSLDVIYYVLLSLYGCFMMALAIFMIVLVQAKPPFSYVLLTLTIGLVLGTIAGIWSGLMVGQVTLNPDGSMSIQLRPLYWLVFISTMLMPISGIFLLVRARIGYWRTTSMAFVFILLGQISAALRPFLGPFPINALSLAVCAYLLGQSVIRSQLFNPLAALNDQLLEKHVELKKASRLQTMFLSNISRDLRTPLNSVIGYSSLVTQGAYGPLNSIQRDRMEKVQRNGQHLLSIVNDILDLNQIEAGLLTLTRRPISPVALVEPVVMLIEPLIQRKQLTFEYVTTPDLPEINVDEQRARQVLINILSNAVKFTPKGTVRLEITRRDTQSVCYTVTDTGIGIRDDIAETIFEEFVQGDSSATRAFEGTGLGLAISRRLVNLHGGQLWFESKVGEGTRFYIVFPIAASEPARKMV